MTSPVKRVDLGRLYPYLEEDDVLGRILYLDRQRLLVVPRRKVGIFYYCDVLTSVDNMVTSREAALPEREINSALRSVDPHEPLMFLVAWFTRAAAIYFSQDIAAWYAVRTIVITARERNSIDLNLDEGATTTLCKQLAKPPPAISMILKELTERHDLLRQLNKGQGSNNLGKYQLVAKDLLLDL